ncbi:MAG: alcohol dehydrogenase catalytic domain-containing protein [Proteobacteria bacterium]|nr:alcohol dehydrogenase catalytic domain-containing protein [Pseudomonadota bacterium]
MKSYQVTEFGAALEAVVTDTPEPKGDEVLLRVKACGVCHSDLHLWRGGYDLGGGKWLSIQDRGLKLPFVMGHEPVGEVVALGPEASGVSIGDTRLVFPWIGCGACNRCREGNDNDCVNMRTIGVFSPGGYADHVMVPHPRYLLDISGIPDDYACTLACAGVTTYSALTKTLPLAADDTVVVIGAGGLGLTGIGIARAYLDHELIVVDIDDEKLEAARKAGATHVVNSRSVDAVEAIKELTGGGAGAVIDLVGSSATAQLGIDAVRKGGKHIAVGLYGGDITVSLPLLPLRNMTIRGSYVGRLGEMHELIDLVRGGKVEPVPVATRPLDQVTKTLEDLDEGRILGRVVVVP